MPCRVMVIDDSEIDLLYARIVLERLDEPVEVLTFDSAREALGVLKGAADRPQLILLDLNMPGMSGFDFLAAYAQHAADGGATAPVALLTSSPDPADRERALAHTVVHDYLVKPLDAGHVRSLLQRLPT